MRFLGLRGRLSAGRHRSAPALASLGRVGLLAALALFSAVGVVVSPLGSLVGTGVAGATGTASCVLLMSPAPVDVGTGDPPSASLTYVQVQCSSLDSGTLSLNVRGASGGYDWAAEVGSSAGLGSSFTETFTVTSGGTVTIDSTDGYSTLTGTVTASLLQQNSTAQGYVREYTAANNTGGEACAAAFSLLWDGHCLNVGIAVSDRLAVLERHDDDDHDQHDDHDDDDHDDHDDDDHDDDGSADHDHDGADFVPAGERFGSAVADRW